MTLMVLLTTQFMLRILQLNRGIWQYGSDEITTKENPIEIQDGVAPQCAIIGNVVRVKIPVKKRKKGQLGFLESHSVDNYDWIFTNLIGEEGDVKPRN
jgi:hypothetical protein